MSDTIILMISLCGAVLLLAGSCGLFVHYHKRHRTWLKPIIILGVVFSGIVTVIPLWNIQYGDWIVSLILASFTALRMFFLSANYNVLYTAIESQGDSFFTTGYEIWLSLIFLLAPLCTATVLISLLGDYIKYAKICFSRFKTLYVFSELNEKSFSLASSMKNEGGVEGLYIFCGLSRNARNEHPLYTQTVKEGFYVVDKEILRIKPADKKKTHYYLFSSNNDKNVDTALNLMEMWKGCKNILICILSNEKESEYLLDRKNAELEDLKVNILHLNEMRAMAFDLLFNNPLYTVLGPDNNVSMLIIGGGELGLEVLKNSLWCSRSGGKYSFDVTIVDKDISLSYGRFTRDCPCISSSDYHITFHRQDMDAETGDLLSFIEEQKGRFNYIVIATDDDEINIKTALDLRASYLRNHWHADISVAIRNDLKFSLMLGVKDDAAAASVRIFPFGSNVRMFAYKKLKSNIWEKYAKCINMIYENIYRENVGLPTDFSVEAYNSFWKDLTLQKKRSSRTHAVFLQYSLWLQGYGIDYKPAAGEVSDYRISEKEISEYAKIEHDRWNTFTLTEGFFPWDYEAIKKLPKNARAIAAGDLRSVETQNKDLRLHGCITDWDTLIQMDNELKTSFVDYDLVLVEKIPDIISGLDGSLGYHTIIKKRK